MKLIIMISILDAPFCKKSVVFFAFNSVHFGRYQTYYLNQMNSLKETHTGAKKEIEEFGLLVCRNNFDANLLRKLLIWMVSTLL